MKQTHAPSLSLTRSPALVQLLGLWALLLQVMVPVGQALPGAASANGMPQSLVICSALSGLRVVPSSEAAPTHSKTSTVACAVCMAMSAGGHFLPPDAAALLVPQQIAALSFFPNASRWMISEARAVPFARGPPEAQATA